MTKPPQPSTPFEPTLALIERRLAALRQEKTFKPTAPLWVLFTRAELDDLFGKPEEAT